VAPLFVVIRLAARFFGGWVAGGVSAPPAIHIPWLGRALLAQGGIAVALAVNYTQVRPDLNGDLILTATLVSVLLFDIVASREVSGVVSRPELLSR
jgi:hypothetical protein